MHKGSLSKHLEVHSYSHLQYSNLLKRSKPAHGVFVVVIRKDERPFWTFREAGGEKEECHGTHESPQQCAKQPKTTMGTLL